MTPEEQTKDRRNWQESIRRRKDLIERASGAGLLLENPHNMKIKELENVVDKAEQWTAKTNSKGGVQRGKARKT